MAALVQSNNTFTNSFASTITLAYSSNVSSGDTLVVMAQIENSGGTNLTISDNQGNTWTQRLNISDANGPLSIWDAINCRAGATTITIGISGGGTILGTLDIAEYSGISAFDTIANTQTSAGTTLTTPSITLASTGEVAIGWFCPAFKSGQTFTAGSGYTLERSQIGTISSNASAFEDGFNKSGTISASLTLGTSVTFAVSVISAYRTPLPTVSANSLMLVGCGI